MKLTVICGICLLAFFAIPMAMDSVRAQNAVDVQEEFVQWEYKVIKAPTDNGFIQSYKLQPKLNELGMEGWECAGTLSDVRKDNTHGHVILKRIKR
ncbi:DUF4177 domain-containing protein [Novipirellula sp. SH528]|uniref:DUF4177 domain-containing protein n=1 Tax=Novipirellula sp. SH528 TaxID=3454466 RepID=UPI003F9FC176